MKNQSFWRRGLLWGFAMVLLSASLGAQGVELYGTTSFGVDLYGGLFKIRPDGSEFTVLHPFPSNYPLEGTFPSSGLIQVNGKVYGTASRGGAFGRGGIYSCNPDGSDYSLLMSFNDPSGELLLANGKFYGTTVAGGAYDKGVIFSCNTDGSTFTVLKNFDVGDGFYPKGKLLEANGKLYGMTYYGGDYQQGTIFSCNTDGSEYTVLKDFNGMNGAAPKGGLLEVNGKLYGMTAGGINNSGFLFSCNTDGSEYTFLKEFYNYGNSADGFGPVGTPIQVGDKLYGMTGGGGTYGKGVIFSCSLDGSEYTVLKNFNGTDGGYANGETGLMETGGKLYGIIGYVTGCSRSIFSCNLDGSEYTLHKCFDAWGMEGASFQGSLLEIEGKLLGVARIGGYQNSGVIYSCNMDGSAFSILKHFKAIDGYPSQGNLLEVDGKIYGTTADGGPSGDGVIFSYNVDGSGYEVLKAFPMMWSDLDGSGEANLGLAEANGKLYGMSRSGGYNYFAGSIYSCNTDGSEFTVLKEFSYSDGAFPLGRLLLYNGKLFGMTSEGGVGGDYGVIFSCNLDGSTYTILKNFDYVEGARPQGSLLEVNGILYGLTKYGGELGGGVIFSCNTDGSAYTVLKSFSGADGMTPYGDLIAVNGKLYGMTEGGGLNERGVIFSCNLDGSGYLVLKNFNMTDGGYPKGSLIHTNGKLYGMTYWGGLYYKGVIFSCNLDGSDYSVLRNLNDADGIHPTGTLLLVGIDFPTNLGDLLGDIGEMDLPSGLEASLSSTLAGALSSYNNCNLTTSVNQLNAFINQVEAQRGKKIPEEEADALIAQAQDLIINILENGNPDCMEPAFSQQIVPPGEEETTKPSDQASLNYFPNPSAETVLIQYNIPKEGQIILAVYDQEGQLVRALFSGIQSAGKHQTEWNGLDESGLRVIPGLYLLRLQTEDKVFTELLIRIK